MSLPPTATAEPRSSAAPDWNNVPFDVSCARCGHDLRGQAEAKCPACSLEFDWRDACPIEQLKCAKCGYHLYGLRETRCPECGEVFDWRLVLLDYRRRQKDLFEYRWREEPIRSFVRTWWKALHPLRFWRTIDIHDQPQKSPLVVFSVVTVAGCLIIDAGSKTLSTLLWWGLASGGFAQAARLLLSAISFPRPSVLVGIVSWLLATFGSLVILRQSMSICRVRSIHVLRACTYACVPVLVFGVLGMATLETAYAYTANLSAPWAWDLNRLLLNVIIPWVGPVIFSSVPAFAFWSLWCAYGYYLRMSHSAGVAFCSQMIAVLATITLGAIVAVILL